MQQFRPFLVKPNNAKIASKNVQLIWAQDATEAKLLYGERNKFSRNQQTSLIAVEFSEEQIHVPEEMRRLRLPPQLQGESRVFKDANGYEQTYVIPHHLKAGNKAVIYARVSSPRQKHNSSFSRQRESCELFANAAEVNVVKRYEEVASGVLYKSRPMLQSALADIERGRAEVLLVESMDRLLRDTENNAELSERIKAAGGLLIFSEQQRIGSANHELAMNVVYHADAYKRRFLSALNLL